MQVGDKDKNGRPMGARFLLSIFARSDLNFAVGTFIQPKSLIWTTNSTIYGPELVELSGNRPPSPRSRTSAFSRLSFEFVLSARTSRNRNSARSNFS